MSKLDTPVLFLIFNRPDTTQQVFNAIRKVRPKKLYVSSDAPRKDRPQDLPLCQAARDILKQIDWDCELHTNFVEYNLGGCDPAVRNGISWFFENEDEGIILEDDCVPSEDFFFFCQTLLEKYRNNQRVMLIGGFNQSDYHSKNMSDDYYFSRWGNIWGWATWKRTWDMMIYDYADYPKISSVMVNDTYYESCKEFMESTVDTWAWMYQHPDKANWDSQLNYTMLVNHGLCIIPKVNLVQNVGVMGTHSSVKLSIHSLQAQPIESNRLSHPDIVEENKVEDTVRMNDYMNLRTSLLL